MKVLAELANAIAWVIIIITACLGLLLFWEDRQDVMEWVDLKEGTAVVRHENSVVVHLAGFKKPAMDHCSKIPFSDIGYTIIDGYKSEASFRYVDDDTPLSTFDGGKLDIGPAEFSKDGAEDADWVGLKFSHNCRGEIKPSPTYWMQITK